MHLTGSYTFKAPRAAVWQTLQSPTVIARCMPGCEKFEEVGADEYEAVMRVGVGPIKGTYTGRIRLHDRAEPERYRMDVEGGGGPGHMKGTGLLELRDEGGATTVVYEGDAAVTGKIASVGQRLLGVTAKQLIGQFFKCMEQRLAEAPVAGSGDA
jgi:uncharacterized protein